MWNINRAASKRSVPKQLNDEIVECLKITLILCALITWILSMQSGY